MQSHTVHIVPHKKWIPILYLSLGKETPILKMAKFWSIEDVFLWAQMEVPGAADILSYFVHILPLVTCKVIKAFNKCY